MKRTIALIVIHSADWPNGKALTAATVDEWHKKRGFKRKAADVARFNPNLKAFGYHYLINNDGNYETGRALDEIPAAVQGHNSKSVNICLAGRDKFTPFQFSTLAGLVTSLLQEFPAARVVGHRDLSEDKNGDGIISPSEWCKTCPGFDIPAWFARGMQPDPETVL